MFSELDWEKFSSSAPLSKEILGCLESVAGICTFHTFGENGPFVISHKLNTAEKVLPAALNTTKILKNSGSLICGEIGSGSTLSAFGLTKAKIKPDFVFSVDELFLPSLVPSVLPVVGTSAETNYQNKTMMALQLPIHLFREFKFDFARAFAPDPGIEFYLALEACECLAPSGQLVVVPDPKHFKLQDQLKFQNSPWLNQLNGEGRTATLKKFNFKADEIEMKPLLQAPELTMGNFRSSFLSPSNEPTEIATLLNFTCPTT